MENMMYKPVSLIIAILLVFINFGVQYNIPNVCGNGFFNSILRNFYHVNTAHLIINLFSFYVLSRVEILIGSGQYIVLLLMILLISSILDFIITLLFPNINCSIGFSGILFGLLAWEMMKLNNFNFIVLMLLIFNVITPTMINPKASLIGHSIGAFAGVISSFFIHSTNINK